MPSPLELELISAAWHELAGQDGLDGGGELPTLTGSIAGLRSNFPVREAAVASVGVALAAAARLQASRGGGRPAAQLDRSAVAAAVRSERWFRHGDHQTGMGFAPLSRLWRAADGWVRTHGNYPWHREALARFLGVSEEPDAVAAAIAERPADVVESGVVAAGGIAAVVRTVDEWRAHPQGAAVAAEPLVAHEHRPGAPARRRLPGPSMAGVRVLDLTRVIAGPVCTRYLGALGAEVLRIDPPHRLDLVPGEPGDTLLAKRSALLDVARADGANRITELTAAADVVVTGYRPGALDALGLGPEHLAERNPGLVVVMLCAWGHSGPWAQRRGFDSVVQAPTGIAAGEAGPDGVPGALPCQLLDHGTGYLAAAAALDGLYRQTREGGTHLRRVSLARTAAWLTARPSTPGETVVGLDDEQPHLQVLPTAGDPVTAVRPPGALGGAPLAWPERATTYGDDEPAWRRPVGSSNLDVG